MKVYKRMTYITMIIFVVSSAICLWLHYMCSGTKADFWINVNLALFGSATLTLLTSLLTYFHERQKTLENFLYHTNRILLWINRYQEDMMLEEKLKFFLAYHDMDKTMWDSDYGNIDFFFERITHNREYIYQNIYAPIFEFGIAVDRHVSLFRWYFNGGGKNEYVMQQFIAELEKSLIEKIEFDVLLKQNGDEAPCKCMSTKPKLVSNVKRQLAGHYYEIMYGKTKATKLNNMEEQNG